MKYTKKLHCGWLVIVLPVHRSHDTNGEGDLVIGVGHMQSFRNDWYLRWEFDKVVICQPIQAKHAAIVGILRGIWAEIKSLGVMGVGFELIRT